MPVEESVTEWLNDTAVGIGFTESDDGPLGKTLDSVFITSTLLFVYSMF